MTNKEWKSDLIFSAVVLAAAILLVLVFTIPAHAQVFAGGGELDRAMAGPVIEKYVRDAYAGVDYYRNNTGGFANPINQGYGQGYGYPGIYGTRGRTGAAITGAIAGSGIGATIGGIAGGRRGALYGAGAGAAAGVAMSLLASNRGGHAVAGPSAGGGQASGFEVANNTPFSIELYSVNNKGKEKYLGRLTPGESSPVKAPKPDESFVGYELVPNERGGLSNFKVLPKPTTSGWTFEPPAGIN